MMIKAILVIYDDSIAGLRYRNPKRINSMALTLLDMETMETLEEHSSIIPPQLNFNEVKYFAVSKALQIIRNETKPCKLRFESNAGQFIGVDESKYKDRINDHLRQMKIDCYDVEHKSDFEMYAFKATLHKAYTALVLYYYKRSWENMPCIECREGVLIRRFNLNNRHPFMGCSKYPGCRFVIEIPKGFKRHKRDKLAE